MTKMKMCSSSPGLIKGVITGLNWKPWRPRIDWIWDLITNICRILLSWFFMLMTIQSWWFLHRIIEIDNWQKHTNWGTSATKKKCFWDPHSCILVETLHNWLDSSWISKKMKIFWFLLTKIDLICFDAGHLETFDSQPLIDPTLREFEIGLFSWAYQVLSIWRSVRRLKCPGAIFALLESLRWGS